MKITYLLHLMGVNIEREANADLKVDSNLYAGSLEEWFLLTI